MPRLHAAVVLATALVALCPSLPLAEVPVRLDSATRWHHVRDFQALVAVLDDWLDDNSAWARRDDPPHILLVSEWEANARRGAAGSFQRGRLRGLYDPERDEILLVRPWDLHNVDDASILLHELVHHRQAPHHWYCPAAQELSAYRLHEAWLAERGMQADVNWVAVVLDAGCTPRDIHPD